MNQSTYQNWWKVKWQKTQNFKSNFNLLFDQYMLSITIRSVFRITEFTNDHVADRSRSRGTGKCTPLIEAPLSPGGDSEVSGNRCGWVTGGAREKHVARKGCERWRKVADRGTILWSINSARERGPAARTARYVENFCHVFDVCNIDMNNKWYSRERGECIQDVSSQTIAK